LLPSTDSISSFLAIIHHDSNKIFAATTITIASIVLSTVHSTPWSTALAQTGIRQLLYSFPKTPAHQFLPNCHCRKRGLCLRGALLVDLQRHLFVIKRRRHCPYQPFLRNTNNSTNQSTQRTTVLLTQPRPAATPITADPDPKLSLKSPNALRTTTNNESQSNSFPKPLPPETLAPS
jgi:hypothetical protein